MGGRHYHEDNVGERLQPTQLYLLSAGFQLEQYIEQLEVDWQWTQVERVAHLILTFTASSSPRSPPACSPGELLQPTTAPTERAPAGVLNYSISYYSSHPSHYGAQHLGAGRELDFGQSPLGTANASSSLANPVSFHMRTKQRLAHRPRHLCLLSLLAQAEAQGEHEEQNTAQR